MRFWKKTSLQSVSALCCGRSTLKDENAAWERRSINRSHCSTLLGGSADLFKRCDMLKYNHGYVREGSTTHYFRRITLSVSTQSIPKFSFGQMAVEVLCLESVVCGVLPTGWIENEFNNVQHYLWPSDWTQKSQYTCIMICAQLSKTLKWSGMCFTCFYFAPFW